MSKKAEIRKALQERGFTPINSDTLVRDQVRVTVSSKQSGMVTMVWVSKNGKTIDGTAIAPWANGTVETAIRMAEQA